MASERIYAPVSRPVPRTGVISSRAVLGGLHQHYARVQVFGTHRRFQRCLVVPDGPDRWRHRRSRPTHGVRPRVNGNERSPRGRRHARRMKSGTDRPPGHLAISFGSRGADTNGSRAALHRASIFCRGVAAAPKATSATSHPPPSAR
jgi:hypothetical protein